MPEPVEVSERNQDQEEFSVTTDSFSDCHGDLHIALFSPSLAGGGAERVLLNLAKGFCEFGARVDIVLTDASGEYMGQVPKGARVVDLRKRRTLASMPGLVRYLRRERPSCLIAFQDHANVVALWAKVLAGTDTPVFGTVHKNWSRTLSERGWTGFGTKVVRALIGPSYRHSKAIVVVSEAARAHLHSVCGVDLGNTRVIYNPVVTDELFEKAKRPLSHPWFEPGQPKTVLAIGRYTEEKDYPTLIRAFKVVRERSTLQPRLMILGEGQGRLKIERLVRELGLTEAVTMPGFVQNPYPYLRRASLFVLSSVSEGLPTVLIEALALQRPIVSTDCPCGPSEILENGRHGILTPVGDSSALADAIEKQLQTPFYPEPQAYTRFTMEAATSQYLELINTFLN